MPKRMYTIEEIKAIVKPVALTYGVERVALFGSYARGDATPNSDIDLYIDKGAISGYIALSGFQQDLEDRLQVSVDVITTGALDQDENFRNTIEREKVLLYEKR